MDEVSMPPTQREISEGFKLPVLIQKMHIKPLLNMKLICHNLIHFNMAHYIDADRLKEQIQGLINLGYDKLQGNLYHVLNLIDSLQQEPLIHTELCTLIACDIIQSTAKRAIEKPQDKDKEEDLMIKKMEYLNMLEKSFFQQEQPEINIPSAGSGAMGTTPPKFKLEVKEQPASEELEEEYQEFCKDNPFPWSSQYVNREYIDELCLSVARHFYELGLNARKEDK